MKYKKYKEIQKKFKMKRIYKLMNYKNNYQFKKKKY